MLQVCQAFSIANIDIKAWGEADIGAMEDNVIEVHGSTTSNLLLCICQEVFTFASGGASDFCRVSR